MEIEREVEQFVDVEREVGVRHEEVERMRAELEMQAERDKSLTLALALALTLTLTLPLPRTLTLTLTPSLTPAGDQADGARSPRRAGTLSP